MTKRTKFFFVYVLMLMFFGLVLTASDTSSAACTITKVEWKKNTVSVGESIQMEVTVQNAADCANQNIGVQIFERDITGDDSIAGPIVKTFTGTSRIILFDYTFTLQDWVEGESETPETIYFSALPQNQTTPKYSGYINFNPAQASNGGTNIYKFNVTYSQGKLDFKFLVSIPRPGELKSLCDVDPFWTVREINPVKLVRNSQFTLDRTDYKFDFSEPGQAANKTYEGVIICGRPPQTVAQSQPISCDSNGTCSLGQSPASCNNNGKCDAGENSITCPAECKPKAGESTPILFKIDNPLEADNFLELIDVLATWLFNIAIPIAVVMIVYAGVMFLTSRGDATKITKARQILLYAVVGLAIIMIGKGFITLIESILNLGAGAP